MPNQADPSHEPQALPNHYPVDPPPAQSYAQPQPHEHAQAQAQAQAQPHEHAQPQAQPQAQAQTQPHEHAQPQPHEHAQAHAQPQPQYYDQTQPYAQVPEAPPAPLSQYAPQQAPPTTLAYTNTFALVSIITAFLSPVAAVVFGHMALGQIKRTGDAGRGLALTGLIIGYSYFAFIALFIIFYVSIIGLMFASLGALMSGSGDFSSF